MPAMNAREMLMKAAREGYAVGAFNVTSIVQMRAAVEAAVRARSPLIVQTSVKPSQFLGPRLVVAAFRALADEAPIPLCLHLDHCTDPTYCMRCADLGYTNIMIDASKDPFEENVRKTRAVVEHCHAAGDITVEGELGTISGVEDQVAVVEDEAALCSPELALRFIEETGLMRNGFSFQAGAGGISLAAIVFLAERMRAAGVKASFAHGGATGILVRLLEEGLLGSIVDLQSFDLEAVRSCRDNPRHIESTPFDSYGPRAAGCAANLLDVAILGATEIDLAFNVNVSTHSDGVLLHGMGGHADAAACAVFANKVLIPR